MAQDLGAAERPAPKCPFDPFSESYLSDPYKVLNELRESTPVFYDERLDYWVVTKYEDVKECFVNQKKFSAKVAAETLKPLIPDALNVFIENGVVPSGTLVDEDPPDHAIHKRAVMHTFSPQKLRRLEPYIRDYVRRYVDQFVKRGHADLVADLTWDVPALVSFKMNGVPDDQIEECKRFSTSMALFFWGYPSDDEQMRLVNLMAEYWHYCKKHVKYLEQNLGENFPSDLIRASKDNPEKFPEDYIAWVMLGLTFAGHETTTAASANMFRALLENREQWEQVCADPALIPQAAEECLRYSSSVICWRRRAKEDVEIGGVTIPAGSNLLISNGAANFDRDVFDEAERLDIHRENANRHLSFGHGAHMCIGAPLGRLEMQIMLEEVSRRLPHMRLVEGQTYTFSANTSFRGPKQVLVQWDPAQNPVPEDRP